MKLNFNSFLTLLILSSLCLLALSCKKKKKEEVAPEDKVTSLNLILDAPKGKQDVILFFNDVTGIAGKTAPSTVTLDANTLYTGTITLEDESVPPKKDVTNDFSVTYRVTGADVTVTANGKTPQVQTKNPSANTDAFLEVILTKNNKNNTTKFPLVVR